MDEPKEDESNQVAPVSRKLKLSRETVRNLTDDILSSQGYSLWTCPDVGLPPRGEPDTTYVEFDAVRVEVHIDVHEKPRD